MEIISYQNIQTIVRREGRKENRRQRNKERVRDGCLKESQGHSNPSENISKIAFSSSVCLSPYPSEISATRQVTALLCCLQSVKNASLQISSSDKLLLDVFGVQQHSRSSGELARWRYEGDENSALKTGQKRTVVVGKIRLERKNQRARRNRRKHKRTSNSKPVGLFHSCDLI